MHDSATDLNRQAAAESPATTPAKVSGGVPVKSNPPVAGNPGQTAAISTTAVTASASPVPQNRGASTPNPVNPAGATQSPPAPVKPAIRTAAAKPIVPPPSLLEKLEGESLRPANVKSAIGAFLISTAVHVIILLGLALVAVPKETREQIFNLIVQTEEKKEEEPKFDPIDMPTQLESLSVDSNAVPQSNPSDALNAKDKFNLDINDMQASLPLETDVANGPNVPVNLKNAMGGRGQSAAKAALVKTYGGSDASEAAVASGLKWLAQHQNPNGSWSFDHTMADCKGSCTVPGSLKECYTGATGMALLAYLGAGQTHEAGTYQETIKKGVNYLLQTMQLTSDGGDLRGKVISNEGMYVQGIASIAICEAHAMTHDRRLRRAAESACNFVIRAQDPKGGGWRYTPRQAGDTSVVGWQVMALKSAQAAKIRVQPIVFQGANHFLDFVAVDGGAQYGYDAPAQPNRAATTAVGLLCRMYLGWKRDNPHLERGVQFLSKTGPSGGDMYYNYYATQVLHHWGGEEWVKWNNVMRDQLVKRQVREGHAAGSWPPSGGHGAAGGRLLETCLSAMTLEVYYRHLPIYDRKKVQVEF